MDHLGFRLLDSRALQRAVSVLFARGMRTSHLHVQHDRVCVIVADGSRYALLLSRLADVTDVELNAQCLIARQVSVPAVRREPDTTRTQGHRWLRLPPGAQERAPGNSVERLPLAR